MKKNFHVTTIDYDITLTGSINFYGGTRIH